jgi:hypothetical protein
MVRKKVRLCIRFHPLFQRGHMIQIENISRAGHGFMSGRRDFLKGMLGASAFVLSVRWMPEHLFAAPANSSTADAMSKAALQPNVYLAIDTDGTAYIIAHRSEIRIRTVRTRCGVSSTFSGSPEQPHG